MAKRRSYGPFGNAAVQCEHGHDVCPQCDGPWFERQAGRRRMTGGRVKAAIERWLAANCRNTAYKATTFVRYYLLETRWFSVVLHVFMRDDHDGVFHSHPFDWVSVFWWFYWEETAFGMRRRCWFVNFGGAEHHRVFGVAGKWTLAFVGRDKREWSYIDRRPSA